MSLHGHMRIMRFRLDLAHLRLQNAYLELELAELRFSQKRNKQRYTAILTAQQNIAHHHHDLRQLRQQCSILAV